MINNKSKRRQSLPLIRLPSEYLPKIYNVKYICFIVFQDSATSSLFRNDLFEGKRDIHDHHIYLEGVLAGWGCCCLQVTFQAQSLNECLHLYDQLLPLTAIMVSENSLNFELFLLF